MILNRTKVTDDNDKRLLQIDEDGIEVDEDVLSYAVLSVTITKDEVGNFVYGLNMITPEIDKDKMTQEELNLVNGAPAFVQRALKLVMDEVEKESNEEEREAKEKAN